MKNEWNLDSEAFDKLLAWLSPIPEEAPLRYEEVRRKLIMFFRGCHEPAELADATFDRIAKKLSVGTLIYEGDPIRYIYGVAGIIYREHRRKNKKWTMEVLEDDPPFPAQQPDYSELEHQCLEQCMTKLPGKDRDLISRYHQGRGIEKIRARQGLASELGIEMNALRIQAFKIRGVLRRCVSSCTARWAN